MEIISPYCGAGGIDEGIKQAGFKTTIAIDINSDCCKTMKLNHDCEVIHGKVSDYLSSLPEKPFAIVGGPPCPEFSRANPKRTYDLCEVNNFWTIVSNLKPKYYLMENVYDMKKFVHRKQFLINCADYGVPQLRERRFFTNLPLPIPTYSIEGQTILARGYDHRQHWVGVKDVLSLKDDELHIVDMKFTGRNSILLTRDVSTPAPTITTGNNLRFVSKMLFSKKYTGIPIDPKMGRALTNEELTILQGFPKDYKFHGSKSSVKIQIGNAVPPPVIKAFFEPLKTLI